MTPNRRLDQLEPLMADALQKIDRLIEGQAQLVELATSTKADLNEVKSDLTEAKVELASVKSDLTDVKVIVARVDVTGQITAKGLANLTVSSQKQFEELKAGQDELRASQELLRTGQEELRTNQDELRANQEQFKIGLDELRASQEQLKSGQDAIMQFLREKLS